MKTKPYKLGWYKVVEEWKNDGSVDMSVHDERDGTIVELHCDTFVDYDQVLERLARRPEVGTLEKIRQLMAA
ncbi:hypothetical protein [uncultured Microbulbifer sp.]|uniref:hypothetical protein n=1 Tax=uncultured Microbulbifer sp. TaxID=348147 RepID=UPI00260A2D81|nr:hypothetical protein [uncultured Microbulbifer sp.]